MALSALQVPQHRVGVWKDIDPLIVLGHTYPACLRTNLCRPHRYYTTASDCTIGLLCPQCLSNRLSAEAFVEEQVPFAILAKKQL